MAWNKKAKAIQRFNRLKSIASVFRTLEIALALILFSWLVNRVPLAVKLSLHFLRQSSSVITSPLFVFAVSNFIIFALIAKSRDKSHSDDLYDDIIRNTSVPVAADNSSSGKEEVEDEDKDKDEDEVVYQDKEIISEVNTCDVAIVRTCDVNDVAEENYPPPVYGRSKSEKFEVTKIDDIVLRRSETEKHAPATATAAEEEEEEMSNEEFQRTIEDFIAKQLKFRRQESVNSTAIVVQSQC
ncbi:hypothetical protein ACFE04_022637 [Oxalis oulophora]